MSEEKDPVPAFAGDEINDKPCTAGEELAQHHSQEERPKFHIRPDPTISQDDRLQKPSQKYGEPELDHGPATSHSVSDGMERPPEEPSARKGEGDHEHCAQCHKRQPHAAWIPRMEKHITESAEGNLRPADEEPLTEIRAAVSVPDHEDGDV